MDDNDEFVINIDYNTTLEKLTEIVTDYRKEYRLDRYDTEEELIKAISVEAGELLNEILFKKDTYNVFKHGKKIGECKCIETTYNTSYNTLDIYRELADVMIYCIALSHYMHRDITSLILQKIEYNKNRGRKYMLREEK